MNPSMCLDDRMSVSMWAEMWLWISVSLNEAMTKNMAVWVCVSMSTITSLSMSLIVGLADNVIINMSVSVPYSWNQVCFRITQCLFDYE